MGLSIHESSIGPDSPDDHLFFAFFYFCIFQKIFLQKYIFGFRFYSSIPLPPGRGPTARQGGGRDLYINKNKFILRRGPWREPAAPCRAAGPLPGGRPPAAPPVGGRGPTTNTAGCCLLLGVRHTATSRGTNIKLRPFPLRPHFLPTRFREGRGRVSEVIPPAKPCRILDPNRR